MPSIITYDTLFELLRREKSDPSLIKIDSTFLDDVNAYFSKKQEVLAKTQKNSNLFSSDQADAIAQEIRNAKKVLAEVYNRREKKILTLAQNIARTQMQQHDLTALLPMEHELFLVIMERLSDYRKKIIHASLECRPVEIEAVVEKKVVVQTVPDQYVVNCEIPAFVGPDLEKYGPFKENDIASIPQMIATILLARGQVRAMDDILVARN